MAHATPCKALLFAVLKAEACSQGKSLNWGSFKDLPLRGLGGAIRSYQLLKSATVPVCSIHQTQRSSFHVSESPSTLATIEQNLES
jgi:hypothetical protein